jgi:tetratricopeptide (TPR) repeat protein
MQKDSHDNEISSSAPQVARIFDTYVEEHLNYGNDPGVIFKALNFDPDNAWLNAHCAAIHMSLEAAEGMRAAQPFLEVAAKGADDPDLGDRERRFIAATLAFARRDTPEAARLLTRIVHDYPTDVSAAKWAQYQHFNLGQASGMLEVAQAMMPALEGRPYVHGMHAFALEQTGNFEAAEAAGRRAIDIRRADPWAHHAVAHVMEMQGRIKEGEAFMRDLSDVWEGAGIFIREHNWWHIALFLLDREDYAGALDIFDTRLWGEWPDFCQEQIGAVSALWRMELRGVDVGARWQPIGEEIAKREFEHMQPFHDLHYIFGLARSGQSALVKEFITSMEAHAAAPDNPLAPVWSNLGVPMAKAIAAYADENWQEAHALMDPLIPKLKSIGGSHAQRDLFVQSWIETLLRTGQRSAAVEVLEKRQSVRPGVVATQKLLDRARQA